MIKTLKVDDLQFQVRWSPRRKSLQLTVDRGGELIISAPEGCAPAQLEEFVREKRFWLYTKLAEKEALRRPAPPKEFVSGEGFPYLGRSYRLLLVDKQDVPLKLERGRFKLRRDDAADGRRQFVTWYTDHARRWLPRRIDEFAPRIGVEPAGLDVRDLGFRWGSCGHDGTVYFHWTTILLPPRIVEYIVVHELAHLHERHHTPEFWQRVERTLPDYEARKRWLAENGMAFVGL